MSSTLDVESKEPNTDSNGNVNTMQSTTDKPKPTKKKKKKNTLYQETAVKYYNGFMKNKRYNKGIKLSTGCAVFKLAWELPESNGLILPSRVVRHLKQVLPKKPKQNKKKRKNKLADTKTDDNDGSSRPSIIITSAEDDIPDDDPLIIRSRTMQNMHSPSSVDPHIDNKTQHEYNRTMVPSTTNTISLINAQNLFCDKVEAMIDEQKLDEDTAKTTIHITSKSADDWVLDINTANLPSLNTQQLKISDTNVYHDHDAETDIKDQDLISIKLHLSDEKKEDLSSLNTQQAKTSNTNVYHDHAHIIMDDLKPDVEQQPMLAIRAHTDIKDMDHDLISINLLGEKKEDINTADLSSLKPSNTNVYNDHAHIIMDDLKPDVEQQAVFPIRAKTDTDITDMDHDSISMDNKENDLDININSKKKKKKKKKNAVLYAEDATKLFRKINDGKRFKNGITLKKTCHIFSVAWELPDENGRVLPSKVARHFKQVLPKKPKQKKTAKKSVRRDSNIKPSIAIKSKSNINGNVVIKDSLDKAQTMRGHAKPHFGIDDNKRRYVREMRRTFVQLPSQKKLNLLPLERNISDGRKKKSMISQLESLISSDPHRTDHEDREGPVAVKRVRAASLTDLDLDLNINIGGSVDGIEHQNDDVIENDIELLIAEQKKIKEKEKDAMNAIDASLGL